MEQRTYRFRTFLKSERDQWVKAINDHTFNLKGQNINPNLL